MIIGKVYVIYNTVDNQEYIGSTTTSLKTRWGHYRSEHNNPKCKGTYNMKICKLMREYGWDKFDVKLIEEIECQDQRELFWHEDEWRDTMRDAGYILTNTNRSIGLDSGKCQKQLARKNARQREKYYNDPEYRERDKARQKKKYYNDPESRQKKLDRQREKISCPDCEKMITRNYMARHRRTCKNFDKCLI